MFTLQDNTLLLIDGHAMAYRSFYALPELTAPDGTPTNAILGFFNMILKIMDEWEPSEVIVVFDAKGPTFRHENYEDYKKGRKPTPEEFKIQLPILQKMLRSFGMKVEIQEGVEADDVIASTAIKSSNEGRQIVALSSDKDLMQILRPGIKMIRPLVGITKFKTYDKGSFSEEYGFAPSQMPDYLALLGDKIDNVPGVPGVGKKTASDLIIRYGNLEGIKEHISELKPGLRKKIEENFDQAILSRDLIYLKTDVPAGEEKGKNEDVDPVLFVEFCEKLGLKKIIERTKDRIGYESPQEETVYPEIPSVGKVEQVSLEEVLKNSELACSFITEGTYPLELKAISFSLMAKDGKYWIGKPDREGIPPVLKEWLQKNSIITDNFKDLHALLGENSPSAEKVFDVRTVHYLLHPDSSSHDLEAAVGEKPGSEVDTLLSIWKAREILVPQIAEKKLDQVLMDIDMPLIPVLLYMENYGIRLDKDHFFDLSSDLNARIEEIELEIAEEAQTRINLNSPKQVAWLLFEHMGLPALKKTKTGFSTNIKVLEELAELPDPSNRIPKSLLEYREIAKMSSGFVDPLLKAVNESTGCIHGTFETTTTGTGRLSSRDPNLQNLPVYGYWSKRLREGLIPHSSERCFVAADYSQVELRVLAHLCGDEKLLQAFKGDRDIHTETASWVFNVEPSFVTPELRRVAKMVNFGILYGMSSFGLAQRMGLGRTEASQMINKYFKALPGVRDFIEDTYEQARRDGYTKTLYGRIRPLDEVATVNGRDSGALKRVAVNSPIQGTAADIAKIAMINFHNQVVMADPDVNLILQVHDSLVCECPLSKREKVQQQLVEIMEKAAVLDVPLKVEAKYGSSIADI